MTDQNLTCRKSISDNRARLHGKLLLCLLALTAACLPLQAQDSGTTDPSLGRYTVSGFVKDAESGEKLIGAALYDPSRRAGATTNAYGFFSLTLPAGPTRLLISYLGYEQVGLDMNLMTDRQLVIELQPEAIGIDEVEVIAERGASIQDQTQMSRIEVPVAQIERTPVLLGEMDVLKTLQLLPGIQSGTEGTSGLYVRGGGPDQNLILLDGAPIYNASHLFGFFSIFNTDAIQNVQMIKGGFPARYGGRLSSVIEVNMKDGNLKDFDVEGAVGLVASRLTVQGPLRRDRTSFILSGRRTYADLLARPFLKGDDVFGYYFYDANAKLNHIFSSRDRLFLSFYGGDDRFYQHSNDGANDRFEFDFGWGNLLSTSRWNHLYSPRLFSNVTLLYSRYRFDIQSDERIETRIGDQRLSEVFKLFYTSGIRDVGGRIDFEYIPGPDHYVRFGGSATHHTFRPGALQVKESSLAALDTTIASSRAVPALETGLYLEDDLNLSRRFKANPGLHASGFAVEDRFYFSLEPRLFLRLLLTDALAFKASYAYTRQYIHLLTNSSVGLPTDLWLPATGRIRPQHARQAAAGLAWTFGGGAYEGSLEGYYKSMQNLIEYREGAAFTAGLDGDWQDRIEAGGGRSYGTEFLLQRKQGRTTGWAGYTLSWSNRRFEGLNAGRTFPYRYDRRHDVSVVLSHRLRPHIDLSATWVYGTGIAVTMPVARALLGASSSSFFGAYMANLYGERNGFRMGAYHRLDLGISFTRPTRRGDHVLRLGVYNAYNRKNPFFIYFDEESGGFFFDPEQGETYYRAGERVARQVSLFPVIPSVSYHFNF